MALSDHLPPERINGPRCTVGRALEALDRDDRHTLLGWLDPGSGVSASRIAAAVRSAVADVSVGRDAVERHRRKDCACERRAAA